MAQNGHNVKSQAIADKQNDRYEKNQKNKQGFTRQLLSPLRLSD